MSEKARENSLRDLLSRQGFTLQKSRIKTPNVDNQGGYMITHMETNAIETGMRFDLSLDEVERFANS